MFLKLLHIILSLFVPANIAVFCLWPSVNEIPQWMIPSIVTTFVQITTVKAAINIYRAWHWGGFFSVDGKFIKWWRWATYIGIAVFLGWIIFVGASSNLDRKIVLKVAKAILIGVNVWYLGFSLMGDGAAISNKTRKIEDDVIDHWCPKQDLKKR